MHGSSSSSLSNEILRRRPGRDPFATPDDPADSLNQDPNTVHKPTGRAATRPATCRDLVLKPLEEVFEAVVDPAVLVGFLISERGNLRAAMSPAPTGSRIVEPATEEDS